MRYYTTFRLSVLNGKVTKEMQAKLKEIKPEYFTDYYIESLLEGLYNAEWYDWEEDLIELSKAFPNQVFVLSGDGEEREDIWRAYFKNGKVQIEEAVIMIGEYDESKLI